MRKENTTNTNATTNTSTMSTVKRAKSIIMYDKNNNARLVTVAKESETEYQLKNNKKIERASAIANISKNRFNVYDDKKSYQSHIEIFKDIRELAQFVQVYFDDTSDTQYFVYANNKTIKLRIQKNAIEIMSEKLESRENKQICTNSKDLNKYKYFVTATTREQLGEILKSLK